jgi:hypothetical protein
MKKKSNNKYPRVLVISHNPFSENQNNGKTLSAFFRQWDIDSLAQLYFTSDSPDFSVCRRFFQINDIDMVKRFFFNKKIQGKSVTRSDLSDIKNLSDSVGTDSVLKKLRNNVFPLFRLLRDILWNIADYKTYELMQFVNDFNPQIIFFPSSNGTFAFSLTKWICQSRNIPLIIQSGDDYVSGKLTLDPFFWIQMLRVRRAYKWAISYSDCVIAIGDKMAKEYKIRFGGNYFVAMNSVSSFDLANNPNPINNVLQFTYAGNLGLNRWKVLALIGESLQELSIEEGLNGELSIYSLIEPGIKELSLLNRPPFSSFKGGLNSDQLKCVIANSDFLVHVEAFDRTNRHLTRLSISTKIPEYLASGRCIFAVGPKDVASMQYLVEYDLGVTVLSDNKSCIKKALREIMLNSEIKNRYAEKGIEVAKLRHDAIKTAESIFQIISKAVGVHSTN